MKKTIRSKVVLHDHVIKKEVYTRPEFEVMELVSEGIICSSTGGVVTDPDKGGEGNWPGFGSRDRF